MNSFFRFFAKREMFANMIVIMIISLGLFSLSKMKKDVYPKVEFGELIITTSYPGASPEDVEINVTNKLEDEIRGVSGLKSVNSYSLENYSMVHVVVEPNENREDVIKKVEDAVNRVTDLPKTIDGAPLVTELSTAEFPVLEVGISAEDGFDYTTLRQYAKQIKKELKNISGVSKLEQFGYREKEVQIQLDPKKLERLNLSIHDVILAIQSRNIRASAGTLKAPDAEKNIITLSEFQDPEEIKDVVIRSTFDSPQIKVKDIATIVNGFEDEKIISHIDGKPAISFMVYKTESSDALKLVDSIHEKMTELKQYLPSNVDILYSNDVSKYVRNRLKVVSSNAIIGLVIVVLTLMLFFNFRTAFWVAMGIPVSLLGVFILLPWFGAYIEVVSLTAFIIIIGIIVDDGIIVAENIARHRENGDSPIESAVKGVSEVYKPVLATVLTTFIAFCPMFFMQGIIGKFIFVIPLVISLALIMSLIEVLIALPAHLVPGLKKLKTRTHSEEKSWFDAIKNPFAIVLKAGLKMKWLLILFFIGVFGFGIYIGTTKLEFVLFSDQATDVFTAELEMPVGTALRSTEAKAKEVEALIEKLPKNELIGYTTRIGTNSGDGIVFTESQNMAMFTISLTPFNERDRSAKEIVTALRKEAKGIKGAKAITFKTDSGGPPVGRPIEVRIIGSDDTMRANLATAVYNYLQSVDGVLDLERNDEKGKPQIEIKPFYDRLPRLGLSVADISNYVRIAFDGEPITKIRDGDEDLVFRVILDPKFRTSLSNLKTLRIPNKEGRLIPLGEVAAFEQIPGLAGVQHYDGERSTLVSGDVDKTKANVVKVNQDVIAQFNLAKDWPGMQLKIGGEADESQAAMIDLLKTFLFSGLGIYFILILLFNSFFQPFMVLFSIPFGLIGVIFAFVLHNQAMEFFAFLGVIGMSGVVVNDALVLVNHLNDLKKEHPEMPLIDRVTLGTSNRLRPIVMTSLTTVGGLLPLAYGWGGADPFMAPMALALGYGILFATPLTLILIPALYLANDQILSGIKRVAKKFKKTEK